MLSVFYGNRTVEFCRHLQKGALMGVTNDERKQMAAELKACIINVLSSPRPPETEKVVVYPKMTFLSSLMLKFAPYTETEGVRFAKGEADMEGLFEKGGEDGVLIATKHRYLRRPGLYVEVYVHYTCRQYVDWLAIGENECSNCLRVRFNRALEHISSLLVEDPSSKVDAI